MPDKEYHLSEAALKEEASDLAFKRIMAVYCEIESKKILEEMKNREGDKEQETVDIRKIDRLISSCEKKDNARYLFSVSKKLFAWVASFVLVCGISVASAMAASADVRNYVFDLAIIEMEKYTDIQIIKKDPSEEEFLAKAKYVPTYIPAGYVLDKENSFVQKNSTTLRYKKDSNVIIFEYCDIESYDNIQIDTENAYQSKEIDINGIHATLYHKDYSPHKMKNIVWQNNDSVFEVYSNAELDILIKFAEGIFENKGKEK